MKRKLFILVAAILLVATFSSCDMILGLFSPKGTIVGVVYDADTNNELAGVLVEVDSTGKTTTTNSMGEFEIEAPEGTQTLHFTKSGYTFYDIVVVVVANEEVELWEDVVGYPPISAGEIRIVLTWGENPEDLDSHLYIPTVGEEVYYGNETGTGAELDWDDTTSYGPETITISSKQSGTYYYSVHHYSGSGSLGTSGAVVKVYNGTSLVKTYYASQASGTGTNYWWRVFSMNGSTGTITDINQFNTTEW